MLVYISIFSFAVAAATAAWLNLQKQTIEDDWVSNAAAHLAQYTQAAASRQFEMGSQFVLAGGYATGTPPAAGMLWLKNPATCSLAGIPALPNDEAGNPVDDSFVPCDFSDENIYGHTYTTSWTTTYPGTRMTIQLGTVPFTIKGERRDDLAALLAIRAQRHSQAGIGDSTLDVFVRYDFDPATATLTAVVDRSAPFAPDPHLRVDGTNMMDAAAPIRWASGLAITPNGTAMEVTAPGGINLQNDTTFAGNAVLTSGNLTVTAGNVTVTAGDLEVTAGTATVREGKVTGVKIDGTVDASLTHAVYDYRINQSGDVINKPTCLAGSTPQVFVAAASVPTGDGMLIVDSGGSSHAGNVQRFRTTADDLGNSWRVWAEVYINGSWIKLGAAEGDLRSSIKCT